MGKLEHKSPEVPLILLPFANGIGYTACLLGLLQGLHLVYREYESVPFPFCQKGIILLVKTKQNPTLQSAAFWDHIPSLDVYTPQHPISLHKVQWLFSSLAPNRARSSPYMTSLGRFCKGNQPPTFWFRSPEFIFSQ